MMQGTVKWFNNHKGYGFITDENGEDVFVHYSAINMDGFKTIAEGAKVEFELTQGEKGASAKDVKVIGQQHRGTNRFKAKVPLYFVVLNS